MRGDGVLLGVVGALVQGLIQLVEGQGLGVGAHGGHGGHDDGVLRGADQHALHVGGGLHGALGVGHAAEAVAVVATTSTPACASPSPRAAGTS